MARSGVREALLLARKGVARRGHYRFQPGETKRQVGMNMMGRVTDLLQAFNVARALTPAALLLLPAQSAFAQNEMEDAAALGACATCSGVALLIPIAALALSIYLVIWVGKDAKARGLDNAVVWMIVVFLFSLLGLAIYLYSRPKGDLVACSSCGNKRLQGSTRCPSCGNA